MTTTMYVLLLMCISNAGKCDLSQHGDAYVVYNYHRDHMVACRPVDERSAHCFVWSDDWRRIAELPREKL